MEGKRKHSWFGEGGQSTVIRWALFSPAWWSIGGLLGSSELRHTMCFRELCASHLTLSGLADNLSADPVHQQNLTMPSCNKGKRNISQPFFIYIYKLERQTWCGIYQGWDLTEDFHLRLVCSVSTATFNGHLLCEPRGKRGTHMNKILGLAKIIRQGCPSHTVVPCRHKDGELC